MTGLATRVARHRFRTPAQLLAHQLPIAPKPLPTLVVRGQDGANGHDHQIFSKTEGNVTFYSGTTTAYPPPHPGDGPAPKRSPCRAGNYTTSLGLREVSYPGAKIRLC